MKKLLLLTLATMLIIQGNSYASIDLLAGDTLDQWYTWIKDRGRDQDPKQVFTIQDGVLRVSGEELGCITSHKEYADYHLLIEFKWGDMTFASRVKRARDSGVLIHSVGNDGDYNSVWMNSLEVQLIEGGTGDFIVVGNGTDAYSITCPVAEEMQGSSHVFDPDGAPATINGGRINWYGRDPDWADVKDFRGTKDIEKPIGEWNRLEIIAEGSKISVLLNGVLVNQAIDCMPKKGRLQIQSEGAEVFFRKVALTPLNQVANNKPLLLVANKHSDTLSFINPETLKVEQTILVGPNPHEMVITPDQQYMYLSNYAPPGNTISLIDLQSRRHIKQIKTGEYTRIHGASMAHDGKNAYFTAGQTGCVVEVDTNTQEVSRAFPTHGKISHMVLVSPDNKRLYTANIESQNVSVIDRKSGELITQIPCEKGVEGMAFTPDGKYLWAANQTGGSMTIIDVATHKAVERFDLPGMPVRIKFSKDGKRAYIPSWTPEGELIVLDVADRKEIKRIKVGGRAIGVELSPDESHAFVGCEDADGLHVVDTKTLEVVAVINTGLGPDPMSLWFPAKL